MKVYLNMKMPKSCSECDLSSRFKYNETNGEWVKSMSLGLLCENSVTSSQLKEGIIKSPQCPLHQKE